jgi:AmmeMemoRadiSam system protein B
MVREPVVAGMFYDAKAEVLRSNVLKYMENPPKEKITAKGIVVPHAGHVYSGPVAGEVYKSVVIPETVIILGPNHTGLGSKISVMNDCDWKTPLGTVKVNRGLADDILKNCAFALADTKAHVKEHSIEVQLPFLQVLNENISIVPICLAEPDISLLDDLASAIVKCVNGKNILLIASSDMTHYESAASAKKKDELVLKAIEELNPLRMLEEIEKYGITMCGWMPVYTMMKACIEMGAQEGRIIRYMNSGETSGDFESVVGYGGAVII